MFRSSVYKSRALPNPSHTMKQTPFFVPYDEYGAASQLGKQILLRIPEGRQTVIVCIGTDRSTGDSLGPFVGTFLKEEPIHMFRVHGTLEQPIHALNLDEQMQMILASYDNPFIVAVDACLGKNTSMGTLSLKDEPLQPGSSLNKHLPAVGEVTLVGVVNTFRAIQADAKITSPAGLLQHTRLFHVMNMAKVLAQAIRYADLGAHQKSRSGLL